jgi:hypothetical protein
MNSSTGEKGRGGLVLVLDSVALDYGRMKMERGKGGGLYWVSVTLKYGRWGRLGIYCTLTIQNVIDESLCLWYEYRLQKRGCRRATRTIF